MLGDVNGDRVTDVAIGAPGEEENMGAVYIFHGASKLDVNPSPSQVRPCRWPLLFRSPLHVLGWLNTSVRLLVLRLSLFTVSQ